ILLNKDRDLFENGREAFKSGEFSMIGGAQLNLLKFRIYGRYVIGLSEINDIPDQDKWKNQAIQVGIGLAF
ncbi:MAG TPA: PorT family protein, partial [Parasegetibacter sp.]